MVRQPRVEKKQAPRGGKRREGGKPQEQGRKWNKRASEVELVVGAEQQKQQNAIRKVLTGICSYNGIGSRANAAG